MKISLRQVSYSCGESEYRMLQGVYSDENGFTNPAYGMTYGEYRRWLGEVIAHSRGERLPNGWVSATTYILYIDDMPVGYGRVRHHDVEGVGNFGYAISRQYRGRGYGSILFAKLLAKCKRYGYATVYEYVDKANTPSLSILLRHGGEIVEDTGGRYRMKFEL